MASWKQSAAECRVDLDIGQVASANNASQLRDTLRLLNHGYVPLPRLDWAEAEHYLLEDEELVSIYSAATGDGHELLDQYEDRRYDDASELGDIDAGIVSIVACLRAMGAAPFTSCCGGWPFRDHHEDHPLVIFHARPSVLKRLVIASEEMKVGLCNAEPAAAMLHAQSIPSMISLARKLYNEFAPH